MVVAGSRNQPWEGHTCFQPISFPFLLPLGPPRRRSGLKQRCATLLSAFRGVLPEPQASCLQAQGIGLFLTYLEGLECVEA